MEKQENPSILFTKDKPVMVLAIISSLLAFINFVLTLVMLRSHDFKVPVQYIAGDGSVLQTSSWYTLYSLGLFSLLSVGATIFLARRMHQGNRLFALALLVVYIVIAVVTLLTTFALLDLVSGV